MGGIIVFEARPYWLPELQRRFFETDVAVRGCSTLRSVLRESPDASLVVLVLDSREAPCLEILGRLKVNSTVTPVICIASESNADLEWPARELGATAFLTGYPTSDDVTSLGRQLINK